MLHPELKTEQDRLNDILLYLSWMIKKKFSEKNHLIEQQSDINRSMWEDAGSMPDMESISDFMQHINLLKENMAWSKKTDLEIVRLDRQFLNPYFARIDFTPDNMDSEVIYIGINTLFHDETGEILIYDWRAPVSGMFYDFETGRASYLCPAGTISGEMTLKRQFRISGGKIELMFDSNVAIQDNILQEMLAHNTSGKMKTIVSTIQKEQNTAIRHEKTKVLAVQGMAGSGKTSVAMHRASYLLYRHKKTIAGNNLVILSSTGVLGEYISEVLPELGEEEIKGITFSSLFEKYGTKDLKAETQPQMMEALLTNPQSDESLSRIYAISVKSSPDFIKAIERLYDYALKHLVSFETITYNDQIIASEKELNDLFYSDFSYMPVARRFERMKNRIRERIKPLKRKKALERTVEIENENAYLSHKEATTLSKVLVHQETSRLNEKIDRLLSINPVSLYSQLFTSDEIFKTCLQEFLPASGEAGANALRLDTIRNLSAGNAALEDLGPILTLSLLLGVREPDLTVKHLIIDEAQDYSSVQLFSLSRLFPSAGVTLLGDINQNISFNTRSLTLNEAALIIAPDDYAYLTLEKSYRSTAEITGFASWFLSAPSGEAFGRHGEKPAVITSSNLESFIESLAKIVISEIKAGRKTIALVTKTQQQANALFELMENRLVSLACPYRLMNENYEYNLEGVMVIPSYMSKGLEFDSVCVVMENSSEYDSIGERGLLYTVLSRALHKLFICCKGPELPKVISRADEVLYDIICD